jgi:hypothetical protein
MYQVSPGGGLMPLWGKDGKHLYYLDPLQTLMAVDVDLGKDLVRIGKPVPLFQTRVRMSIGGGGYDVTRDGRFAARQLHHRKCHAVDFGRQLEFIGLIASRPPVGATRAFRAPASPPYIPLQVIDEQKGLAAPVEFCEQCPYGAAPNPVLVSMMLPV